MKYVYNDKDLIYEIHRTFPYKVIFTIIIFLGIIMITLNGNTIDDYEDKLFIVINKEAFTKGRLEAKIIELNIKFPDIVMAQAELETGNFKHTIFIKNHNLFGMKQAKSRPTLAKGTMNNHAFYNDWTESVIDYALYQTTYLRGIKTEEAYLSYLGQFYAEDPLYVSKLKNIIKRNNAKDIQLQDN